MRLARSDDPSSEASPTRVWPWVGLMRSLRRTSGTRLWPMLVRAALAAALWASGVSLPRIPAGDIVIVEEAAFHASAPLGAAFERVDWRLRQWPAAGLSLLSVALVLAATAFASR